MYNFVKVVVMIFVSTNLLAQTLPDESKKEEAKRHFDLGKVYYKQSEYNKAIDEFQKAYSLYAHSVILYNIAQAYEKEGNIPMALRFFREYLRAEPNAEDKHVILISIQNLEKKLQEKGIQQVGVYSTPSEAEVAINGKVVGKTPFAIELKPGKYTISLTKKGFLPIDKEFVVSPDRSIELDFSLNEMNVESPKPVYVAPPGQEGKQEIKKEEAKPIIKEEIAKGERSEEKGSGRLWTYIVGGTGGLMIGGGAVFGIMANSAESDLKSNKNISRTQEQVQDLADNAQNYAMVANILYGAGAVAIICATLLFFVEGKSMQGKAQAWGVTPFGNGYLLTYTGNF